MAIASSDIFAPVIDQPFEDDSYTKELEGNNKEIAFKKGSKTVKVYTVDTSNSVTDHDNTKTFSQQLAKITNANATLNTYTLDQAVDIGQFLDKTIITTNSAIKDAGKVLHAIVTEQLVPKIDGYRLGILAGVAATNNQKVTASADGYKDVLTARAFLINSRLFKNVIMYVNTTTADSIRLSDHFKPYTGGLEKTLRNGDIGMLAGMKVKEVPTDIMPTGVGAIIVNPAVVSAPRFLDDSKVGEAPAAFGQLLLGLYMYTCVVSSAKKKGVATIGAAASA